jgi:hypothetical protein
MSFIEYANATQRGSMQVGCLIHIVAPTMTLVVLGAKATQAGPDLY